MDAVFVIKLSALGDLVQADGALRDIREHHRHANITVMTTPPYLRYMQRCPWVDRVFVDPRAPRFNLAALYLLRRRLRKRRIDLVYDLQQVGRTRFYKRWLFPKGPWVGDIPGCSCYLKRPEGAAAADHFAHHLRQAGVAVRHTLAGNVSWMADDVTSLMRQAGLQPGFVLLIPGASDEHHEKRWPHFAELARHLIDRGYRVVTVPGPADRAVCRAIPGDMLVPDDGYYDLFTLAGLAAQARFVVGNDTGPTHMAAHLRKPGLALFGGHAPALSTGIQHTSFSWLEADDLQNLPFAKVWQQVERLMRKDF